MLNVSIPEFKSINAPFESIHFCPACHHFFTETPQESSLFRGLMVCPHCRKQDNDLFAYWMNYRPILERHKLYKAMDYAAFLINDQYTYVAHQVEDGWSYALIDEEGEVIESGELDEPDCSYMKIMNMILDDNNITANEWKEVPWATANAMLNLTQSA